jgi:hypothetical protein
MARASACALLPVIASCTSADTSLTTPTNSKCQVQVTTSAASYPHSGGSGTLAVSASRDCQWSATAAPTWVALTGKTSGQGDGVLRYTVAENPLPAPRSGAVVVSDEQVQLSQAGAPCRFSLSHNSGSIGPAGGQLTVEVATLAGCSWSATSRVPWISVASGQRGAASGAVTLSVQVNSGGARSGAVGIADQTFIVAQTAHVPGPPSPPQPAPPPPSPPPANQVEFEGRVWFVWGRCPDVAIRIEGATVVTSASTAFNRGSCSDLSSGDRISGHGRRRTDGAIDAASIHFRKDDDDD